MDVRKLIPLTDNIRARLTEATINMHPYNSSIAQLEQIDTAMALLVEARSKLLADLCMEKASS